MRFLREYYSIANRNHFCDCCHKYISPGEQYKGQVYVYKKHGIIVSKQHSDPACDFPYDEFEDILSESNNLEYSVKESTSLNIAA